MFKPEDFIQKKIEEIKEIVGQERALVATSGGVDSSTCAVLAARALAKSFFKALKGIEDPEKKRKVFREVFYKTLGEIAKKELPVKFPPWLRSFLILPPNLLARLNIFRN